VAAAGPAAAAVMTTKSQPCNDGCVPDVFALHIQACGPQTARLSYQPSLAGGRMSSMKSVERL
jgi:hypothetical protein